MALGMRRRCALALLFLLTLTSLPLRSQQRADSTERWYDTLEVTKPRYAHATTGEKLALSAFTALALPIGFVVSGTTLFPPSINLLFEGKEHWVGIVVGTGVGFGGDTLDLIYYPVARLQFEGGYYFMRPSPLMMKASLLADYRIASVHSRDFVWAAVAGGGGVATDFKSASPYAELWAGFLNPLGIRYVPLFPMHHYGIRARAGYDFAEGRPWYEVSLVATSTFGW